MCRQYFGELLLQMRLKLDRNVAAIGAFVKMGNHTAHLTITERETDDAGKSSNEEKSFRRADRRCGL